MKTPRRMWLVMTLLGLAGTGLFITLVLRHGIANIATAVAAARWGLLAVFAFHLFPLFFDALSWRVLFPSMRRPAVATLLALRWICESVNALLPVAQIGGDMVRIRLIAARGTPLPLAVATGVASITLSVVAQIIFTLAGLALLVALVGSSNLTRPILTGLLIAALFTAAFYAVQRFGLFRLMVMVFNRCARSSLGNEITRHADAWDQELHNVYGRRRDILLAAACSLCTWASTAVEMWIALWALGSPTGYGAAFVLESMGQAVRSVAFLVPGALGVQEGTYLVVGMLLGIPSNTILALALIRRARELVFGVPALVTWQTLEGRRFFRSPWRIKIPAPAAEAAAEIP